MARVGLKLEAVVIPVSDVDRAKEFYGGLGWRLDADFSFDNGFRGVQFTPPGSECSIQFGAKKTSAAPGSARGLYLVVSDIEAARDELVAHGVEVSEVFHPETPGDQFQPDGASGRISGLAPGRESYGSFATFSDPDGNGWLLQEVTTRLPGHVDATVASLAFPDPPLQADGIVLRPWRQADVPAIVRAVDPAIARYIPTVRWPYTEQDACSWLASQEPARLAGHALELAIADADTDVVLGAIAAHPDPVRLSASVGYWLAPEARGHGCATAATRLLCEWLFESLELGRIELTTDPENIPSQRVAERCGFKREGLIRSHLRHLQTGERRDSLLWSLLPDELVQS